MRPSLFIACVIAASCDGRQLDPQPVLVCTHPCDLAQTLWVSIVGAEAAAAVTVTEPCHGSIDDCGPNGCRTVTLYLSTTIGPAGDAPPVCHLTAVSRSGVVVERDVTASYSGDPCCAGYEFSYGASVEIDFSKSDAGTADGPGDAAGG
jgi:hypothetical protein